MFSLYQNHNGAHGSLAEVWIDKDNRLTKKIYKPNGITIRGNKPVYQDIDVIRSMYENEIRWSNLLRGDLVLEIYEHGELTDEPGFYLIQDYVGPDLLHYYDGKKLRDVEDPVGQIVDMFKVFRDNNLYKLNNAMSNMVNDGGRIRAFDFKYAVERSDEKRGMELDSVNNWLRKIDPILVEILPEYI